MTRVIPLHTVNVFARWMNNFFQILNVCGVNDVKQTEIHTAEPPVPEMNAFDVEMAVVHKAKISTHQFSGETLKHCSGESSQQSVFRGISTAVSVL